jgi:tetratricopeptide (TPR) repeat protein/tRNA A-37 threonylcarbamoyl transferase component Bud32
MNPELESLFEQAAGLAATEREQFLAEHCSDPDLRREVELLLAHDRGAETFLQRAVSEEASSTLQILVFAPGQRLGPYRVLSVIGRGGMGLVYLAERADGKFEQRVAIKVLQSDVDLPLLSNRAQQECRILASLQHPNIAHVLDAGVSHDGLPYFVMEYVDGLPLDRYSERHHLSLRDRLRLLLPLCDALHLAHQKLIVHRDLKPDNILVTEQGVPKLLDFGIAKVLGEVPVSPQNTATRILTPEYASPEQARGEPVTTATDIYSLGGVLYRLLTGSAPHQTKDKSPMEMVRAISEEEVRRPSELRRELAGDIDSILLKALHTDPQQRYRSVDQFAADLESWLEGKPVLAVPPSLGYRARKFGRRHRVVLATVSAVALALVVAAVVSIREGIRANRETAVAEAVNDFLQNDLLAQAGSSSQSGPDTKPDPDLKVRTALDRAAQQIEGKFAKQPEVEASIRDTIGWTYLDLGLYPEARKQLARALELRRRALGEDNPKTLETISRLGRVAYLQGKDVEAEVLEKQALEGQRRVQGPENPGTLNSTSSLASVYQSEGKYAQAEALHAQILETERRVFGPEHPSTVITMGNLANDYQYEAKYAQAEVLEKQALEIMKRIFGPEGPRTLHVMEQLTWAYESEGKYAEAETLQIRILEIERRVLGPEHPDSLHSMAALAAIEGDQGKYAQAEVLETQTLQIQRRVLGPEHPDTLVTMGSLAAFYGEQGKYDQADSLQNQTLEIQRRVLSPENPATAETVYNIGCLAARRGHKDRAITLLTQSVDHGLSPYVALGMDNDADLASLHGDPRFVALVAHAKQVAEAKQKAAATQAPIRH